VALCASQASAVTIGDAVASLCSPAQDALQSPDFSSLKAALDAASTVDLGGEIFLLIIVEYFLVMPKNIARCLCPRTGNIPFHRWHHFSVCFAL